MKFRWGGVLCGVGSVLGMGVPVPVDTIHTQVGPWGAEREATSSLPHTPLDLAGVSRAGGGPCLALTWL